MNISFGVSSAKPMLNGDIASLIELLDDMMKNTAASPSASKQNLIATDVQVLTQN